MGVYCRRWGIPLIDAGTVRLPRLVGEGRAMDLILTGRRVDADEALRIGLCEYVVPEGEARTKAESLAHDLCRFPQACMRAFGPCAARSDRTRRPAPGMVEQQGGSDPRHRGRGALRGRQGAGRRFRGRMRRISSCATINVRGTGARDGVDCLDYHERLPAMLMHNPSHPGAFIRRQCLEPLGLTVSEAAKGLAVSRNTLSMCSLSASLAMRDVAGVRRQSRKLASTADAVRPLARTAEPRRHPCPQVRRRLTYASRRTVCRSSSRPYRRRNGSPAKMSTDIEPGSSQLDVKHQPRSGKIVVPRLHSSDWSS